jgi:UDP-glucose 4-epimerase
MPSQSRSSTSVLVTGGAGYIGSHTCVALLAAGQQVVVVDDLSNSHEVVIRRIEAITGASIPFYRIPVQDEAALGKILTRHSVSAAIHFAAHKAVGDSVKRPLAYYENNLGSVLALARALDAHGARRIVFSSSATVYGEATAVPIREDAPTAPANPYGWTKLMAEQILRDLHRADPSWNISLLRYFNPAGAHESGMIGEDPLGIPNNLMPYVARVAVGELESLQVFGDDYPTPDGTGVRDYIHVMDLAEGHVRACAGLDAPGLVTLNLGTGRGCSVLEVVRAFERASGRSIPFRIVKRRPGDVACAYADPSAAERALGWRAIRDLDAMCADAWRWQSKNPQGFAGEG